MFFQPCCRDQRPGRVHLRSGTGRGQDHQVRRVDKYFCSVVRWNMFRQVGPSEWGIHDDQRRWMVWLHGQWRRGGHPAVRQESLPSQDWNIVCALEWGEWVPLTNERVPMLVRLTKQWGQNSWLAKPWEYWEKCPGLDCQEMHKPWHVLAKISLVINKWHCETICNPFSYKLWIRKY